MCGDVFTQSFESEFGSSKTDKLECFLDIESFVRRNFRQAYFEIRIVQAETVFFGVVLRGFLLRSVTNQRFYQHLFFSVRFLNLLDGRKKFLIDVLQKFYIMNCLHHIQSRQAAFGHFVRNQSPDAAGQFFFRLFHQQVDSVDTHLAIFETKQLFHFLILFGR